MSKHVRRPDGVQQARPRPAEGSLTQRLDESAAPGATSGEAGTESAGEGDPVGKYWIVIILWSAAFALMIGVEVLASLFRR